ncbi:hypothetical protein ABPG75_008441 [Micractinium tetrahymenae]
MLKRDFGILLLSVCALYLSLQHEGAYQFRKAWYHSWSEHDPSIHKLEEHLHPPPPPLVTDLNGDGKPEVIMATPSGKIQILAPRRFGDGFAKAELLSQHDLDQTGKMRIAAMRSGYLTPPPKELVRAPRKQVVVIVTSDLRLLCLNHNLQKLWEQDLAPHYPDHGGIRELAIHISDQHISGPGKGGAAKLSAHQKEELGFGLEDDSDHGIVVVGASVVPLTAAQREELENEVEEEAQEELMQRFRAHGRKKGAANQERRELERDGRHFSYFAFEGATGAMRWMHEAKDFHRDLGDLQDQLVQQHAFHKSAEETEARHYGEASCRDYRASVLAALPHSWHSAIDTKLVPQHFAKHKEGAGAQKQALSKMGALKGKQTPPGGGGAAAHAHGGAVDVQGKASKRGGAPAGPPAKGGAVGKVVSAVVKGAAKGSAKAKREAALPPNVVVAHLEEGIEAIHLYSGRTVCRLHLPSPGLHVDLNGDGVPEHIIAVGGDPDSLDEEGDEAWGHKRLTYCYMSVMSGVPARLNLFNGTICRPFRRNFMRGDGPPEVLVAPPIFLPQPGKHGHYRAGVGQKGLAVFLNSLGELTAYSSEGDMEWQHYVGTIWHADEDEDAPDPVPTLRAMPLRPHSMPTVILAAGEEAATLVSEHGNEVDSWELPDKPLMPLQLADFNFDGYTDVLLVTQDGIWAWAQVRHPGALPFSALVAALMVIMAAVFITQQQAFASSGPTKRRPLRSTERED